MLVLYATLNSCSLIAKLANKIEIVEILMRKKLKNLPLANIVATHHRKMNFFLISLLQNLEL
jgi:hypothetical protein